MKDIVDRLSERDEAVKDRGGDMLYRGDGDPLVREAKAEIERLLAAINEAHDFLTSKAHVSPGQRIANATITLADAAQQTENGDK